MSPPLFSSDHEVLPFMFEPVVPIASSTSESEENSSSDEGIHPRLLNLDW